MAIVSADTTRLDNAIQSAEDAFWADIVASYPEATSGDLSPCLSMKLAEGMVEAVTEWLMFNVDESVNVQTAEILLHRVEYYYRGGHDNLLLTDSDKEYIAYSISEGISEGEHCTLLEVEPHLQISVYCYWKINNNPT